MRGELAADSGTSSDDPSVRRSGTAAGHTRGGRRRAARVIAVGMLSTAFARVKALEAERDALLATARTSGSPSEVGLAAARALEEAVCRFESAGPTIAALVIATAVAFVTALRCDRLQQPAGAAVTEQDRDELDCWYAEGDVLPRAKEGRGSVDVAERAIYWRSRGCRCACNARGQLD